MLSPCCHQVCSIYLQLSVISKLFRNLVTVTAIGLHKCPQVLFDVPKEKNRNKFITGTNETRWPPMWLSPTSPIPAWPFPISYVTQGVQEPHQFWVRALPKTTRRVIQPEVKMATAGMEAEITYKWLKITVQFQWLSIIWPTYGQLKIHVWTCMNNDP
jgi:hypothetical protein